MNIFSLFCNSATRDAAEDINFALQRQCHTVQQPYLCTAPWDPQWEPPLGATVALPLWHGFQHDLLQLRLVCGMSPTATVPRVEPGL